MGTTRRASPRLAPRLRVSEFPQSFRAAAWPPPLPLSLSLPASCQLTQRPSIFIHSFLSTVLLRVLTSGSLSPPQHLYSYGGSFRLPPCHHDCHPFPPSTPPPPSTPLPPSIPALPTHVFCLNSTLPIPVLQSPLAALSSSVSSSFLFNV